MVGGDGLGGMKLEVHVHNYCMLSSDTLNLHANTRSTFIARYDPGSATRTWAHLSSMNGCSIAVAQGWGTEGGTPRVRLEALGPVWLK